MKHLYYLLTLCLSVGCLPANAQNWRPFRPNGDVHAFHGASADTILTMRLDSAGRQGADSTYYFNRVVRRGAGNYQWRKAANNQFGKELRYSPTERTYYIYWDGGPTNGFALGRTLVLKPFARVGTSWASYFSDYGVQTTLLSRGVALIDGVSDSVATFRLTTGAMVVLSKNNGLVSAPADLLFGVPSPKMLTLARRPAAAGRSYYNPVALLDLQPGDELGYYREPAIYSTFACYTGQLLRRVLTRQLTADSVIYTFQQQSQITYSTAPGCYGNGLPTVTPANVVRLAASLRTGTWAGAAGPNQELRPVGTELLAYEYRTIPGFRPTLLIGYPVVTTSDPSAGCGAPALLRQQELYQLSPDTYYPYFAIDAPGWMQQVGPGFGIARQSEQRLTYFRRTVDGVEQTCGSRTSFGTLLPTKAARHAADFALYPNPAGELATLRLAGAARTATTIRLLDGLGRLVGTQVLAAGQTSASVNLQGLPSGAYVVEVQAAGTAPQRVRLQHQQ